MTAPNSQQVNPNALTVADAARLLSAAGSHSVTPEHIMADLAIGAPANGDGTINLLNSAAWLVRELSTHED